MSGRFGERNKSGASATRRALKSETGSHAKIRQDVVTCWLVLARRTKPLLRLPPHTAPHCSDQHTYLHVSLQMQAWFVGKKMISSFLTLEGLPSRFPCVRSGSWVRRRRWSASRKTRSSSWVESSSARTSHNNKHTFPTSGLRCVARLPHPWPIDLDSWRQLLETARVLARLYVEAASDLALVSFCLVWSRSQRVSCSEAAFVFSHGFKSWMVA